MSKNKVIFQKKNFMIYLLTAAMVISEPLPAFAEESYEDEFYEDGSYEEESYSEEVYFEQENEDNAGEDPMALKEEEPVYFDPGARLITGFQALGEAEKTVAFYKDKKPALNELLADFPQELTIFTEGGEETLPVTWYSVGADFENSDAFYYQFSPQWDGNAYRVEDSFDIIRSAPYIEVFILEETAPVEETEVDGESEPAKIQEKIILNFNQSANKKAIYDYLTQTMGFNTAAASGVLANIYCESGFNPNALGDNGTSYGICQWHNGRYQNLKAYCADHGYDYRSLTGQLNFLNYELNHSYGSTLRLLKSVFNDSEAAYYAGYSWCYNFERPKNYPSVSITRGNLARDKYWASYVGDSQTSGVIELERELSEEEEAALALENGDAEETEGIIEPEAKLSQTEMNLLAGGKGVKLTVLVTPEEIDDYSVTWKSTDADIAYVSGDGFVLPKAAGETTVKATVRVDQEVLQEQDAEDKNVTKDDMESESNEIITELVCNVVVRDNDLSRITEPELIELKSIPSGPVKIGRYEKYVSVWIRYENAVTYTGNAIIPDSDLNASVDISELTAIVDELGFIRKGEITSAELFHVSYRTENAALVGTGNFYPVIALHTDKASAAGLKRREIAELELVIQELNEKLLNDSCSFTINPIDIASEGLSVRIRLKNKEMEIENGEILNVRSVKLTDENHTIYELRPEQYELKLMDINGSVILTVSGEERLTGSRVVEINH